LSGPAVVDCSALFDFLVMDVGADFTPLLSGRELHAPQLLDYEFLATLRRYVALDRLGASSATDKLELFSQFSLERHGVELLRRRIWALRHDFSPYDASYVALAEALDLPLVTSDLCLAKTASRYCDVLTP
jgi:predicted nucleic acid-binding protein